MTIRISVKAHGPEMIPMSEVECIYHSGHEERLKDLEKEVDRIRLKIDIILIMLISIGVEIPAVGLL